MAAIGAWVLGDFSKDDRRLIGFCRLEELTWLPEVRPATELSYYIDPSRWGQGLGPEAVAAMFDWAIQNRGADEKSPSNRSALPG